MTCCNSFGKTAGPEGTASYLSHLEAFREDERLAVKEIRLTSPTHSRSKANYVRLWETLAGDLQFREAGREDGIRREGATVYVTFEHALAGLPEVRAVARPGGTSVPVSQPVVYTSGRRGMGRVEVGPLPSGSVEQVDLHLEFEGLGRRYVKPIVFDEDAVVRSGEPPPEENAPVTIHVRATMDVPLRKPDGDAWDKLLIVPPEVYPDVRLALVVDSRILRTTRIAKNVRSSSIQWDETYHLDIDPRLQHIGFVLLDADPEPFEDEVMGKITWAPGSLPTGERQIRSAEGLLFDFEVQWTPPVDIRYDSEPFVVRLR
ncbi:MAG: hypothetical protein GVY18_11905 [Bacteroidetes bacterium]|jgi:hypothetical protein|nr:hypothetical protein [Bacteroidota bacterium]